MRITNINRNITPLQGQNTWKAWYNYIETLDSQVQSIYNYLYYLNPDYKLINSPNWEHPWTDEDLTNYGFMEKILIIKPNPIPDEPEISQWVTAYFPAQLTYRQGFLNLQDTDDALLLYTKEGENGVYLLDTNEFLPWEVLSESTHYIRLNKEYELNATFPSGYCCISNVQPIGEDNEYAEIKHHLSSYLIYPLGNGGFYTWDFYQTNLNATFQANELANLSNVSVFNFSLNTLRFVNYTNITPNSRLLLNSFIGYSILNNQINPQIADYKGNVWTGQENIHYDIFTEDDYELIIADTEYNINSQVTQLYQQSVFNVKSNHRTWMTLEHIIDWF